MYRISRALRAKGVDMRNKKWGSKNMDGHVHDAAKRRRMKRTHEKKTRQAAKRAVRRELNG